MRKLLKYLVPIWCAAFLGGFITGKSALGAEPELNKKLDTAIELLEQAVEDAKQGKWLLGNPTTVCPGFEAPKELPKNLCESKEYSCRCL